jgi:two-component system CheB/CheR fusion protein
MKERLQNTIESSAFSTDELKASNEKLQSLNEELTRVNLALKTRVEEAGKINDDLHNLIAATDIATVFVDRTMCIRRFTPQATLLFNLNETDVGSALADMARKLCCDWLVEAAAEAFRSLRSVEREVSLQDGVWHLARALPYRTLDGRIEGSVLTFVDITSRRKTEEAMRLIAESTRDYAIVTLDLEGRITTWNEGAEKVFGYTASEAAGESLAMIFTAEDREAGILESELRRARDDGRAEDDRWQLCKDGSRIFCNAITTLLHYKGQVSGYARIVRDVTASKRVESERERLLRDEIAGRAEAQAASELKDEFLAVMSHELKNPLNLIQLNADLLTRLPEARALPAVQRAAAMIRRTVFSQAQIIDDLLDLSRVNTGKLALHRTAVDWSACVDTIASAMREEAAAKGVTLSADCGSEPLVIDADVVRVEQIVWNLLTNAVKFTPAGGTVSVKLLRDDGFVQFAVLDSGRGIAPEVVPHVFEMFKQAEPGGMRHQGGLGIGLAVVRHLAVLHGGRITVSSPGLDQGSTFRVWLPLAPAKAAVTEETPKSSRDRLMNRRVLVVDDDPSSVETLRRLLETEGLLVVQASNAVEALAHLRATRFDVVLTDIAMSRTNGQELLRALQQDERNASIPVLALTGAARAADVQRAMDAGFRAHLSKPVSAERLLGALDELLGCHTSA